MLIRPLSLSPSFTSGLGPPLQQYPFSEWQLCGLDLLQLSYRELEQLGVQKIGHQELILEAVEEAVLPGRPPPLWCHDGPYSSNIYPSPLPCEDVMVVCFFKYPPPPPHYIW